MKGKHLGVAVLALVGSAAQVAGASPANVSPSLTVAVCDRAAAGQTTITSTEHLVDWVYRQAGIAIRWIDGCSPGASDVQLNLLAGPVPGDLPVSDTALGYAVAATQTANVRLDRILSRSLANHVCLRNVMGAVIAHELGHLLLGPGAHTPSGIMQPAFDLSVTRPWALAFSHEQIARMRSLIADRDHPASTN